MPMVERVARAIYEARYGGGSWGVLAEQRAAEFERAKWLTMARAAIQTMREPTEIMVLAGDDAIVGGIQPEAVLEKPWRSPAIRCHEAMIDAALDDTILAQRAIERNTTY